MRNRELSHIGNTENKCENVVDSWKKLPDNVDLQNVTKILHRKEVRLSLESGTADIIDQDVHFPELVDRFFHKSLSDLFLFQVSFDIMKTIFWNSLFVKHLKGLLKRTDCFTETIYTYLGLFSIVSIQRDIGPLL